MSVTNSTDGAQKPKSGRLSIPQRLMDTWKQWRANTIRNSSNYDTCAALYAYMNMPPELRTEWYQCFREWFDGDTWTLTHHDRLPDHEGPCFDGMPISGVIGLEQHLALMLNTQCFDESHRDLYIRGIHAKLSERPVRYLHALLEAMVDRDRESSNERSPEVGLKDALVGIIERMNVGELVAVAMILSRWGYELDDETEPLTHTLENPSPLKLADSV